MFGSSARFGADEARAAGFAPVGAAPGWASGPIRTENLLVIDEGPRAKLRVRINPGPRIHCRVACTATAKIKLDLPGRNDPASQQFTADLIANRIYRPNITLTKATLVSLRRQAGRSRLVVDISAREIADGSTVGRSDRDVRTFAFRPVS